jgi:hypothetical protein
MLTKPVPLEVRQYPYPSDENVIIDTGDGYYAVKRPGFDWEMERKRSHAEIEEEFYRLTSKSEILDMTQREWRKEYQNNVREGKIREDRREQYITGYIASPFLFDERIAWLEKFSGELDPAGEAWIKNTRELIEKYHVLYERELEKDYFRRINK